MEHIKFAYQRPKAFWKLLEEHDATEDFKSQYIEVIQDSRTPEQYVKDMCKKDPCNLILFTVDMDSEVIDWPAIEEQWLEMLEPDE